MFSSDTAIVIVGLKIASFTYGGLLGIFLVSHTNQKINSSDIIMGLISSIIIVFYLSHLGIAWIFYIFISLSTFILFSNLSYYLDLIVKAGFKTQTINDAIYLSLWIIMSIPLFSVFYNMILVINNTDDVFMVVIFSIIVVQLYIKLYRDLILYMKINYE